MSEESLMKRPYVIREDAVQKLRVAMQDGLLTVTQTQKIYDNNFDEFFSKPIITQLEHSGVLFMGDEIKFNSYSNTLPTPKSTNLKPRAPLTVRKDQERPCIEAEEKETIASFLFSTP